jgi:hypothetical protein
MGSSSILSDLFIIIIFLAIGLGIIGSGQIMLAVHEIAMNTRKEDSKEKGSYSARLTIAKFNIILGWLVIIVGAIFVTLLSEGGGFGSRRLF